MKECAKVLRALGFFTLASMIFPATALAYLDPGTGSYFMQIVIGGLLGALFSVKMFWRNLRGFFSKKESPTEKKADDTEG